MRTHLLKGLLGFTALAASSNSFAGGPFGIDHRLNYNNSGVWNTTVQDVLVGGTLAAVAGGALWQGSDNRLGRSLWQSVDSIVLSGLSTQVLKVAFSRKTPAESNDPNAFFKGGSHSSFPSAHVTALASAITPLVLEYGKDYPAVYGLEGLVAYEMVARLKVQEHWQSDVLVAALIGTGFGYYAYSRNQPLILSYLPQGLMIGWKKQF